MSLLTRAAIPLILAGAAACADPSATAPTESATPPAGPATASVVSTDQEIFTWFMVDAASGMQVHFGRDIQALCSGGDPAYDLSNVKVITNPQEALRQLRQVKGDLKTSVWPIGPNSCAYYNSTAPLATGISNFRGTDNDVAPFNRPDPKNHDAFGFMANGRLTGADGSTMQFAATYRGVWDGIDPATIKDHTDIRLH
ncbi:MAG TPA: hypothetical protein VFI13_04325 [Gemmatimonadales bacterium]|nr:hypothetical protein [Gemmatimonadales bacterium]